MISTSKAISGLIGSLAAIVTVAAYVESKLSVESKPRVPTHETTVPAPTAPIALIQSVSIEVLKISNGKTAPGNSSTQATLVDALLKAGIPVSRDASAVSKLHVPIELTVTTTHSPASDTFSTDCAVNYEVVDNGNKSLVATDNASAGPVGGFLAIDSENSCIDALLPAITIDLTNTVKANI